MIATAGLVAGPLFAHDVRELGGSRGNWEEDWDDDGDDSDGENGDLRDAVRLISLIRNPSAPILPPAPNPGLSGVPDVGLAVPASLVRSNSLGMFKPAEFFATAPAIQLESGDQARTVGELESELSDDLSVPRIETFARSTDSVAEEALANAAMLIKLGDFPAAVEAATKSLKSRPDADAYLTRATANNLARRYGDATRDALQAARLRPTSIEARRQLAWALFKSGRFAAAVRTTSSALALDPRDDKALALRAFGRSAMGDRRAALDDIRLAAARNARFKGNLERAEAGLAVYHSETDDGLLSEVSDVAWERPRAFLGLGIAGPAMFGAFFLFGMFVARRRQMPAIRI